ncbi:putative repeat protein (TIGR01451 family)/gliding motility-associated-like protein [Flavobacterium cutihirudinis]|uniref:Putative repeat protein (TIGR01451 family)/gliding motility-associated-like protein n=1 Tax=Flavobacterium cutihirudinis TaxID=1265740 RepID=A0A3D9G0R1_9FLAO|nr:gliding motility-associated C-terminal domain-containing protein [Flavobacterium cutihirudinis]RED26821.1 putative repeat protein (TIGR01451 family)/gliding motility-associated-like protein [Flavobacterium cutihirudinis]
MAKLYFFPKITDFSRKACLTIFLLVLANFKVNAQNCTVNAGVLNTTICETDALVLTGNTPSPIIGTVSWTQISGPAVVINSPNSTSTTISGYTGGNTYTFRYSATCSDGILSYQDKVVNVKPITKANAGGNIASCPNSNGTLAIIGNAPQNTGETGRWEIVGANNAGVVINFPNLATSTITLPDTSCGVTTLQWVIEGPEFAPGQRCRTTSQITVTNYGGVKPVSAGPDQTLSNCYTTTQSTNLNATYGGCGLNGQNGQWTFVTGPNTPTIGSPNSNNTSVSNLTEGTYTFRWTVTGPCASGNDLVVIIVPPATQDVTQLPGGDENIFFCDNTINQVTLVAQTPLYAGETVLWTKVSGGSATIVSPTNPTTLVTGISEAGSPYRFRYTLTNNNTGCVFTKDYIVQYNGPTRTIVANNGDDIVGSCNATVFTIPLTVTGTGSNQYRIVSGPALSPLGPFPTALQDTGNSLTLTLTAPGDYTVEFIRKQTGALTVECDYGFDTINILVSGDPTPSNAGTDVNLPCGDTSTLLSGVSTDDGLHFWSQLSGPNTAVIADNFAVDTQVSGLISGSYVFQYITKGGGATCGFSVSTVTVNVSSSSIDNVNAGQDQVVCADSQVPLSAIPADPGEIGTWSQISGPDTITFSNVNDPNAIASGFLTPNATYELQWSVGYLNPGPSCGSAVTDNVIISTSNLLAPTPSDAGPDTCYSSGTTTFNLSGNTTLPTEFGTWTVIPSNGVIIDNENDPNTSVTVPGNGTYIFTWTIVSRFRTCLPSESRVKVTVAETPPTADAGPDQEICGTTLTMAATQSGGSTGTWTRISGVGNYTISDIHDPNAVFTFSYSGYYIFRWTVDANICGQDFDDINLTIGIPPNQAAAGPDQNICNNSSVTMAGSAYDSFFELGQWSVLTGAPNQPTIVDPSNPNTVINGLIAGTYTFRWTVTAKSIFLCSGSFDDMIVIVDPAANAGPDQTACDVTSIQLKASDNSRGTWTLTSKTEPSPNVVITQSPSDSYIANATVVPGNSYVFTFTTIPTTFPNGASCAGTSDSVNVTIYSGASIDPNAGPDQTLCIDDLPVVGVVNMAGNAPPTDVTTAVWRFVNQPAGSQAEIDDENLPTTTISKMTTPGLYILEWVFESNNCRTLSDIVRIQMNAPPSTANAGPDDTVACQTSYQTAAVPPAVGIGTWTITTQPAGSNAIINNPNSPVTTLSNVILGTYVLTWTVTNGPHTSPSLCQPSSDTVTIIFNDTPPSIANAGPDQEYCDVDSFSMNAVPVTSGKGTWTQTSGPPANIASPESPTSLMLGIVPGTYVFKWTTTTVNNNGCTSTDSVTITVYDTPSTANAGIDQVVPQFTPINLNAVAPTVGTGNWTQTAGPSTIGFTDPTSPTSAVTGTIPGIYTLQWSVTNGNCPPSTDTMRLTILAVADLELTKTVTPTTGSVGDIVTFNIDVYNNNNAQGGTVTATNVAVRDHIPTGFIIVPGSVTSAGQYNVGDNTITWTGLTIPSGSILHLTFKATISPIASYVNSAEVIASDQFDPDSTPNNGIATEDDQDSASIILDVADLSLQKTVSPTSVSINDNVIFTIRVTNSGPNNATGITVSDHLPPGYTYVSDNGGGKYNNATGIWNVGNLNNGNSLALQITAKVNVVSTLSNYINTAEIQTAKQKDPDSTPGNGLPEDDMASANITLKSADLELTKAVAPTSGAAGDEVEFTVTVLNNGPGNATGVSVQDVIPEGFTLIPGSVSNNGFYNIATATITWQGLTIANAGTLNLTFRAIVNPLGGYLNTAQITASDLADPDSVPNNDDGDQSEDDEDNAPFTFIGPTADLSLIKRVVTGNTSAVIGSQISFELIITNSGPNTTTGVLVQDLIPSGYEFVNYSSSAGLYENTFGIWNVGTIASGVSESLIIDVKVLPTGNYVNTAQVTASSLPDPNSAPNNDDGDQSEDDEDSATITPIQPAADLSLTKTVSNPTPLVGSFVTFQIITTNSGPQDAANVTVTDLLPSGYTYSSFNATSGTYDSTTGIWSLDILKNTESETLQITAIVNATGDYTNIAEVTTSDTPDPDSTPNNGITTEDDYGTATTVPVPQLSDLSLTKTVNNAAPVVGSEVTFEIIVTNNGPQDNNAVQVTDLLPSGYTFTGYRISTGTYDSATGVWHVGNLVNGDSETLQLLATVNATGNYTNSAEVTGADLSDPDSTPNNGVNTEDDYAEVSTVPVPQSADLSITKTVSNATPLVGSQVTFSIQVSNAGPQATTGITVTDLLPSGYTYVSYTSTSGSYNPSTGLWTAGALLNGATQTLQITATVNSTGTYLNSAEVTASDLPDPDSTPNNGVTTEDDYATATVTPTSQASDLSLTKTVNNATPLIGSSVTFEIVVTNNGPQDNTGVQVTDLLPSGYTFSGYTVSTGTFNSTSGIWSVGNLNNGTSQTLQITATVNATGDYLNIAEVTAADQQDPDSTPNNAVTTEDDYATATVTPTSQASDLSLTKTVNNATPLVGSTVTFEIVVTNSGPQDNTGVQVSDLLPTGYTFSGYTVSTGTFNSTTGVWSVGNLNNGTSQTLQITAIVNATGDYLNFAEVTAANQQDPDSTPNNGVTTEDDYATATVTPTALSSDLSLTKTVNNTNPIVDTEITFELVITNSGPQDNTGVQVTDLLPVGFAFTRYTVSTGTYDATTGLWNIGNLRNGQSESLQIAAIANAVGNFINRAEVTAADLSDPDSTPNNGAILEDDYAIARVATRADTPPPPPVSDLSLTKTVNNATPLVGSQVTFEVIITNSGKDDNENVEVTDLLPSGYTLTGYTVSTGTYTPATGLWVVGNIINGKSETLQITATVNATGDYLNIAEITAADFEDPDSLPNNGVTTEDDYATATTTPIAQSADLSLTKTVNNATPLVGAQVTFEVVVTNNGPQNTTGVTVTDLLPTGYTFNSYSATTGTYNNSTGLWTVGSIANGGSYTLQITATVNSTGTYLNSAEVTASDISDPDSTQNNGSNSEDDYAEVSTAPIQQSSDLSLTKTVNNATPLVGAQVTFEVVVTNNGPQDNTGVQVTDLLPTGYTFNEFTVSTGTYNSTTGIWTIGNLNNGQSQTLQITATANITGDYINIAEISAANLPDPDSTPNNGVATEDDYATATTTPIAQSANLSLTKTVNNAIPLIGSSVTFEVIITNNGPQDTAGVEVTDLLPTGYTFGSYTATKGTYNATTGKWIIGSLINGDAQTLQITAVVNPNGPYNNVAEVTASNLLDPNSTPNNGVVTEDDYATATTTPIAPVADLSLTKFVVGGNLNPIFGATVTFEITVRNSGPHDATGVSVKDLLPSGYEYVVYSATTGQYANSTGVWNIGTIPNGESETLLVGVKVNRTGDYNNTAEIYSSNEHDPDSTPNNNVAGEDDQDAQLVTPVPAVTDLSIEKSVVGNNLTPAIGSQIAFTITVTNDGPSTSTGVTIKDILPPGYQYLFYNSTSGSYDPTTGIWTPGTILSGNSHTLLINALVKVPTNTLNEYLNIAEIMTSDQFDPDSTPGNGVVTEDDYDSIFVTPVIVMADLSISKTALNANATYDVGSTVIFTVTVKNDGPATTSGVSVKDLLPPGFKYVTSSPTSGLYNYITGVWNVGVVTAGNDESLDIYTTVNPPTGAAGEYTNTTEIIASNLPDPDSTPNNGVVTEDDYDSLQINIAVADLSLDKTVSNKNANVDEVITFTLQLNNEGPSTATGVNVDDIIPLGYRNITNISNGGIFSNNTIKWDNLTVPIGGITLTYQVTVANPTGLDHNDYLNMAQVTASNQFDPDSKPNNDNGDQSEDDEDSEFINIPSTDIAINKEVDKTDVPMYSSVIFTVTAENLGNLTATNVEVKDLLPKGYELESATATSGTYNGTTGIWTIPSVLPKESQVLTLNVKVVDFKDYLNIAHLNSMDQIDTNSTNNEDSATVSPNCLKIWNEFSPNDDGQNDTFYIDCITQYPNNKLEIFNRWGNIVYYKQGYDNTWDGKAEGSAKTLPEGTYFYILDLGDGSPKTSGWLYLK